LLWSAMPETGGSPALPERGREAPSDEIQCEKAPAPAAG
jgi:hypothetical protein